MSINRRGSTARFACDDCGEEADTEGMGFSAALETIKADGWSVRPDGEGGYTHKCPDCGEPSGGDRLAAQRALFGR